MKVNQSDQPIFDDAGNLDFFRASPAGKVHVLAGFFPAFDGHPLHPIESILARSRALCGVLGDCGHFDHIQRFADEALCENCRALFKGDLTLLFSPDRDAGGA